jgi:2-oxoglutarate dehydrogenase complex dehydrogenase (E1) component-like enzyme
MGDGGDNSSPVAKVVQMVRAFQVRGHLLANLDPLGLMPPRDDPNELTLEHFGFGKGDLQTPIDLSQLNAHVRGFLSRGNILPYYHQFSASYCYQP